MKTISYKGYQASVEFDGGSLFVKVLHIDDVLVAECDKASEAEAVAHELIEDYLADCLEEGREPAKPFKGNFNVRVSPETHKRAAMQAVEDGVSLNAWVGVAINEKLECSKLSERIDGVISHSKRDVSRHMALISSERFWSNHGGIVQSKIKTWEDGSSVMLAEERALDKFKLASRRVLNG